MKFFILAAAIAAFAADPAPPAKVNYSLSGLKPGGFSQYNAVELPGIRQYLRFQADSGMHYLIYEEQDGVAARKDIANLHHAMNAGADTTCTLEIECDTKAFCTGDCQNLYYEFTNAPKPGRNHCSLHSFDCSPRLPVRATIPVPAQP